MSSPSLPWLRLSNILSLTGLFLTLLAFGGKFHWVLELLSAFRVQFALAALPVILIGALCKNPRAVVIAMVALGLNLASVWPYLWPGATPQRAQTPQLTLMQFNMFYMNFNHAGFLQAVQQRNPDVVALEEVERHWVQALRASKALKTQYPHQLYLEESDLAVLSHYPLTQTRAPQIIPYFRGDKVLITQIQAPSGPWTLAVVHPNHPTSGIAAWKQVQHINYFVSHFGALARHRFVMAGDFNAPPWFYQYGRLERKLKLKNTRQGFGIQPTWPASLPNPLMIPIDHVLTSRDIQTTSFAVGPDLGSDHLPVWVGLKAVAEKQERPQEAAKP